LLVDLSSGTLTSVTDTELFAGANVVRAVSGLATPTFTYTAAMQATDFGGPITNLSTRLYQIGALGRGVPLIQTLTIKESL